MDGRAAKRRRLSPEHDATSIALVRNPEPATTIAPRRRNAPTPQSPSAINGESTATTTSVLDGPSAQDLWKAAKAKSRAGRAGRKSVDVYDDIDGANKRMSLDRFGHDTPGSSKPKEGSTSTKRKAALDPLKNQRGNLTSSPKKVGTTLGFFKQFARKPDTEVRRNEGTGSTREKGETFQSTRPQEEAHQKDVNTEEQRVPQSRKKEKIKHSWHYEPARPGALDGESISGKERRTFEDEIRVLESKARKEAEAEESDDGSTDATSGRRTSKRQAPPARPFEASPTRPRKPVSGVTTPVSKPASRRKMQQTALPKPLLQERNDIETSERQHIQTPVESVEVTRLTPKKQTSTSLRNPPAPLPETKFSPESLQCIQRILHEKTTGMRPTRLANLDDEYIKVSTLINQTVTAGESNSMLLIGARGSGKSTLVNKILQKQTEEHPDDFHVVRLNGFIHTDDKIALREIWRQLGREMELEDAENTSKNYADTLTTLLALLSHPSEMGREDFDRMSKSVIFILDEFDLFASHPRQTLLYNLFDIAQSRKAPIAVLGLTTRIDVSESLEKRVKSRFSHRYVHLSMSKSLQAFEQACTTAVTIALEELSSDERIALHVSNDVNAKLQSVSSRANVAEASALRSWNAFAEHLLSTDIMTSHLRRLYYTTKSVPDFLVSILLPIASMSIATSTTSTQLLDHFTSAFVPSALQPPDSNLDILGSLSSLQLALLICAARQTAIHGTEVVSFSLAYEEYKLLASKARIQASASGALAQGAGGRVSSKDVAKGAWEELVECGLIMKDARAGASGRVDVGLEEIGMCGVELGGWGRWCREI